MHIPVTYVKMKKQKEAVKKLVKAKQKRVGKQREDTRVREREKLPNRPNYRPENPTRPANVTQPYLAIPTTTPAKQGIN